MNTERADALFNLHQTFDSKVYFYCCDIGYQHLTVCLAEGLKELGIPFYSNINYWRVAPGKEEYLLCHDPKITPDDCSVVVLEKVWVLHYQNIPENLFHIKRKYITIYLDDSDGPITQAWSPSFINFDIILRTHYNSKSAYPANFRPWTFGLSNRIIQETQELINFHDRSQKLLINFRNRHNTLSNNTDTQEQLPPGLVRINSMRVRIEHPLREIAFNQLGPIINSILPVDDTFDEFEEPPADSYHYLHWVQTDRRHYPNYYHRLKTSAACAGFGGYMVPYSDTEEPYVEWWDSWRFWESLAAGCVTFHIDFEKYNVVLPVMPENWRHYIGIELDNLERVVERIANEPGILERISIAGREWAIENYGPAPTALRFLEIIRVKLSGSAKTLPNSSYAVNLSLSAQLKNINLIIFPDWSAPEDLLGLELKRVIKAIVTNPCKQQIALLIDTSNIAEDEAHLLLSTAIMNLLMEEDLDVNDGPEISLVEQMDEIHWEALWPHIYSRIVLKHENKQAISTAKAEKIVFYSIDNLSNQHFVDYKQLK